MRISAMLSDAKIGYFRVTRQFKIGSSDRSKKLVILIYHRIGSGTNSPIDIPISAFEEQLNYLADCFQIVSLDQAISLIHSNQVDRDLAVLTFDDGYFDFYSNALPILLRRKFPAVLYLATHFVDTATPFPWDMYPLSAYPHVRPLTWSEVTEISRSGLITIGSHTHLHKRVDRMSNSALAEDLQTANQLIRSHLGETPIHFAYPRGISLPSSDRQALADFKSLAVAGWRPNLIERLDFKNLYRIPALPTSDIALFSHSLSGAGWPIDSLSKLRNKIFA